MNLGYLARAMKSCASILFLLLSALCFNSCCKEQIGGDKKDIFVKISERNQLPFTLSTASNIANNEQTKGLFFYDQFEMDVIFRSIGVLNSTSERSRLWVEIKNPDLKMFASTRIDSLFGDTINVGNIRVLEIHNRADGKNFYKLDTSLLAWSFLYSELDTERPDLNSNTIVTAHIKLKETYTGNNFAYDVERGALKRKNQDYIGFKNIKDGNLFFIELEDRYTLKSIEVRKD